MKVYKGVNKDLQGYGGFQYEVGKTYEENDVRLCARGFHGCEAPMDVLRYYGLKNGNRYFEAELDGVTDERQNDTKRVGSKITLGAEIGIAGIIKAQIQYTREKAKEGTTGGDGSNFAGGDGSNFAGGKWSNFAGGDDSNLAGGDGSNFAGGDGSNFAGGKWSNFAGGDGSNFAGGDDSNLAGGECSVVVGGNGSKAKAGIGSVIVLVGRKWCDGRYKIVDWKAGVIDGKTLKPDTWYKLENGEFVEAEEDGKV